MIIKMSDVILRLKYKQYMHKRYILPKENLILDFLQIRFFLLMFY